MDPVSAIGLITAVASIVNEGFTLSQKLYQYYYQVKRAEGDLKSIATEVENISLVLTELRDNLEEDEKDHICKPIVYQTALHTVDHCTSIFKEIDGAVSKSLRTVHGQDGNPRTVELSKSGRLLWPIKRSRLEVLRSDLDRLKSNLSFTLSVISHARHIQSNKDSLEIDEAKIVLQKLEAETAAQRFELTRKQIMFARRGGKNLLEQGVIDELQTEPFPLAGIQKQEMKEYKLESTPRSPRSEWRSLENESFLQKSSSDEPRDPAHLSKSGTRVILHGAKNERELLGEVVSESQGSKLQLFTTSGRQRDQGYQIVKNTKPESKEEGSGKSFGQMTLDTTHTDDLHNIEGIAARSDHEAEDDDDKASSRQMSPLPPPSTPATGITNISRGTALQHSFPMSSHPGNSQGLGKPKVTSGKLERKTKRDLNTKIGTPADYSSISESSYAPIKPQNSTGSIKDCQDNSPTENLSESILKVTRRTSHTSLSSTQEDTRLPTNELEAAKNLPRSSTSDFFVPTFLDKSVYEKDQTAIDGKRGSVQMDRFSQPKCQSGPDEIASNSSGHNISHGLPRELKDSGKREPIDTSTTPPHSQTSSSSDRITKNGSFAQHKATSQDFMSSQDVETQPSSRKFQAHVGIPKGKSPQKQGLISPDNINQKPPYQIQTMLHAAAVENEVNGQPVADQSTTDQPVKAESPKAEDKKEREDREVHAEGSQSKIATATMDSHVSNELLGNGANSNNETSLLVVPEFERIRDGESLSMNNTPLDEYVIHQPADTQHDRPLPQKKLQRPTLPSSFGDPLTSATILSQECNLSARASVPHSFKSISRENTLEAWTIQKSVVIEVKPELAWTRVVRIHVPVGQKTLQRRILVQGLPWASPLRRLLSLTLVQQQQIEALLQDKNMMVRDTIFHWELAALQTRPKHATNDQYESLHIIIKLISTSGTLQQSQSTEVTNVPRFKGQLHLSQPSPSLPDNASHKSTHRITENEAPRIGINVVEDPRRAHAEAKVLATKDQLRTSKETIHASHKERQPVDILDSEAPEKQEALLSTSIEAQKGSAHEFSAGGKNYWTHYRTPSDRKRRKTPESMVCKDCVQLYKDKFHQRHLRPISCANCQRVRDESNPYRRIADLDTKEKPLKKVNVAIPRVPSWERVSRAHQSSTTGNSRAKQKTERSHSPATRHHPEEHRERRQETHDAQEAVLDERIKRVEAELRRRRFELDNARREVAREEEMRRLKREIDALETEAQGQRRAGEAAGVQQRFKHKATPQHSFPDTGRRFYTPARGHSRSSSQSPRRTREHSVLRGPDGPSTEYRTALERFPQSQTAEDLSKSLVLYRPKLDMQELLSKYTTINNSSRKVDQDDSGIRVFGEMSSALTPRDFNFQ